MAERAGAGWRLPWEPLVVAAVLLAGWEVSARVLSIPEYLLPRPLGIVETMVTDAGQMLSNLALTLGEALAGFAGGVLLDQALRDIVYLSCPEWLSITPKRNYALSTPGWLSHAKNF